MKKIWRATAILLLLAMLLPLVACSGGEIMDIPTFEDEDEGDTPVVTKKKVYNIVPYSLEDIVDDIRILGERSHFEEGGLTADWPWDLTG